LRITCLKSCVFYGWINSQVLGTQHIALWLHVNRLIEYWIDSVVNRIIYVWIVSSNSLTWFESTHVGNQSYQSSFWVFWVDSIFVWYVSFFITFSSFPVLSYMVWIDSLIKWIDSHSYSYTKFYTFPSLLYKLSSSQLQDHWIICNYSL
jgi:hypothetical protein